MAEPHKEIELQSGVTVFRYENDPPGGYTYLSDEIGVGVFVWNTALISPETLRAALSDFEEAEDG